MASNTIIPYDVVYCTSQDPDRPITNLRGGDPAAAIAGQATSLGWQSACNGKTPQTLVLRFPGIVWLHQLRILSHEFKIASSVEVRVFKLGRVGSDLDPTTLEHPQSYRTARFMKLGTVDFNTNEHSQYKAKERKTVHLKTEAYFVKLLFNGPHPNELNPGKQIGLYAIECVGHVIAPVLHHADRILGAVSNLRAGGSSRSSRGSSRGSDSLPRHPHLTTSAASTVAPQRRSSGGGSTTHAASASVHASGSGRKDEGLGSSRDIQPFRSVRILEFEEFFLRRSEELLSLKEQAITLEDFETATECRDKLTGLNKHSRSIYQLEQEKVQAIIEEDFDKATDVRNTMNRLVERAIHEAKLPDPRAAHYSNHSHHGAAGSALNERATGKRVDSSIDIADDAGDFEGHGEDDDDGDARSPTHQQRRAERDSASEFATEEDHDNEEEAIEEAVRRGAIPSSRSGSCHNEESPAMAGSTRSSRSVDRRTPGGHAPPVLHEENVDDTVVSRIDAGEVVLRLQDIPTVSGSCERLVSTEILAATGEEENGTVVVADVSIDMRPLLQCVGQFPTACLVSRRFKLREAALTVLSEAMHDYYAANAAAVEDAVLRFLDYNGFGLQDAIPNVVFAACTFVRIALLDQCQVLATVSPQVVALLPRLLTRAADPLPRVREEALMTLTLYAKTSAVPAVAYVAAVLADPLDKERRKVPASNPRAQLARLAALQAFLEFGGSAPALSSSAMTLISKLLIPAVNHSNFEVRDTGTATLRKLVETLRISLKPKDLAKINNASLREAIVSGKRPKRT